MNLKVTMLVDRQEGEKTVLEVEVRKFVKLILEQDIVQVGWRERLLWVRWRQVFTFVLHLSSLFAVAVNVNGQP